MVLVEEVQEDVLFEGERESDFESESSGSETYSDDDDDFDPASETVYDRVVALKDIVSPRTRSTLYSTFDTTKNWALWGWFSAGSVAWWVSTSALLVGLPLALAIEDETRIVQQEREMQMQSQGQQQASVPQSNFADSSFSADRNSKECYHLDSRLLYNVFTPPIMLVPVLYAYCVTLPRLAQSSVISEIS